MDETGDGILGISSFDNEGRVSPIDTGVLSVMPGEEDRLSMMALDITVSDAPSLPWGIDETTTIGAGRGEKRVQLLRPPQLWLVVAV